MERALWKTNMGRCAAAAALGLSLGLIGTDTAHATAAPEDADFAMTMTSGQSHTRNVTDESQDTYVIAAPKNGFAYFEVTVNSDNGYVSWDLFSDAINYDSTSFISYGSGRMKTPRISARPGQRIELRLDVDNAKYTVRAISETPSGFESEPNDTKSSATKLTLNKTKGGIADSDYDTDFYSYKANADGFYTLKARLNDRNYDHARMSSSDANIKLGAWVNGKHEGWNDAGIRYGSGWIACEKAALRPNQTIYGQITNDAASSYADPYYEIKVTRTKVPVPTIKKLTSKKKSFIVKWSRSSHINGYQIRYSTHEKMNSAKTKRVSKASTTKTTIKKLKHGKRYYVQVRAYYDSDYQVHKGFSWSNKKSIKVK